MLLSSLLVDRNPSNRVDMRQTNQFGTKPLSGPVDGLSTRKAVMSLSFIGILVLFIVAVLSFNVLATHLIPYAADSDISPLEAAAALGLLGGVSVPARIFSGYISDRFGYRKILAWSTLLMGLSMLWLIRLEAAWMLYAFVIFYGISAGARTTVHFGIIGNFFGMRSLAELTGIVIATGILISAGGTYLAGLIFDLYGSYFAIIIGMLIALVITGLLAFRLKPPETTKQETSG
jgi:MFS family permease